MVCVSARYKPADPANPINPADPFECAYPADSCHRIKSTRGFAIGYDFRKQTANPTKYHKAHQFDSV
jgi:hypothetical protein